MLQELLAMVPRPVIAVLLLFPVTSELDQANDAGRGGWSVLKYDFFLTVIITEAYVRRC